MALKSEEATLAKLNFLFHFNTGFPKFKMSPHGVQAVFEEFLIRLS